MSPFVPGVALFANVVVWQLIGSAAEIAVTAKASSSSEGRCIERDGHRICSSEQPDLADAARVALKKLTEEMESLCVDNENNCAGWAEQGECAVNPAYMFKSCRYSCGVCKYRFDPFAMYEPLTQKEMDDMIQAAEKKKAEGKKSKEAATRRQAGRGFGADKHDEIYRLINLSQRFGTPQTIDGSDMVEREATKEIVSSMITYMRDLTKSDEGEDEKDIGIESEYSKLVRGQCRNKHELCCFWATLGECDNNAVYMSSNCGPCCGACILEDYQARCPPLDKSVAPFFEEGGVNELFERLTTMDQNDSKSLWSGKAIIHSQPPEGPWIVEFPQFIKPAESEFLSRESKTSVTDAEDESHAIFWCVSDCDSHPISRRLQDRIESFMKVGLPSSPMTPSHIEYLFVTRYEKHQSGGYMHDIRDAEMTQQCGPRALTVKLVMESPKTGGVITFDDKINVAPQQGSALVYANVLDKDPHRKDERLKFQISTVQEGALYDASAWVHLYDFRTPHAGGCVV